VSARESVLALRPAAGISPLPGHDSWIASTSPIRFSLAADDNVYPQGWVLLTARLSPPILDGSARLIVETDAGEQSLDIPVSVGGRVYEVVKLPPRIRRLVWEPSRQSGGFEHTPIIARRLSEAARLWMMIRRVAFMSWQQPLESKRRVGLAWWRAFFDLPGQYRACGKLRSHHYDVAYEEWIERFDRLTEDDRRRIRQRIAAMRGAPRFALVVCGEGDARERTLRSIDAQLYPHRAIVAADAPIRPADYVAVLQAGDALAEHALYWVAESIIAAGDVAMAYADEDRIDASGLRSAPQFKPDWSPEHLRSINYVGRWALVRGAELARAGGLSPPALAGDGHELNLRVAAALGDAQVVHVPGVLYHGSSAHPAPRPAPPLRHPLPANAPLVTIVIPTRDQAALLRQCIESVESRSTYRNYELLIVDNRSTQEDALRYLAGTRHQVLRYDAPFNYSAMNNLAVRRARGEALVLLNNDTSIDTPDWLEEMLGHLHQQGVGVVGAKLLYTHGAVQHGGTTVGPGGHADHLHVGIARDAPGYCHRAVVAQELSAVTGACLMTWKALYERLGGLNEPEFPVEFNDVDYCLRVQAAGYRVIYTPHAVLYHDESASRGRNVTEQQRSRAARDAARMRRKWAKRLQYDPYYNPNLSYVRPDFSLSDAPRVRKPWLRPFPGA
jgi:GT2 family glycosyltransferase